MAALFNGAGVLVAMAAPFMLIGLLWHGTIGGYLRRIAIFLAIVLPLAFMIVVIVYYRADPQFDFNVNYQAAITLYAHGGDPYAIHAAYSFPFPTFYLYWLIGGALSPLAAWYVWWLINAAIWVLSAFLLWRSLPRSTILIVRDLRLFVCAAIPAVVVLWQGQTALMILIGLVALHYALIRQDKTSLWIGGAGLSAAALIKPQLALVGLGLVIWSALVWHQPDRREAARRTVLVVSAAAIFALLAISLTILIPGGVTFATYRAFIVEALPQVARPADNLVIGSPSFVVAAIANSLGLPDRISDPLSTLVSLGMVGIAAFWTWRRRREMPMMIAAGWGVWAMIIPRVAWTWYAVWCLPFLLFVVNTDRRRMALLVIVLALFSLQLGIMIVAVGAILGLLYLLWTWNGIQQTNNNPTTTETL